MKNIVFGAFLFSLFSFLPSCKEIGPDINLHGPGAVQDTTFLETPVAPEARNVVIEEITGVKCTNCPQGHAIIATIESQNPDRIVAVGLHPLGNALCGPYSFSLQDLQKQKAADLYTYFGQLYLPSAAIDRKMFPGEPQLLVDKTNWATYVTSELSQGTPVNLLLSKTYDSVSRQLTVIVELHYTQAVTESNRLTIMLAESNIVTAQLNGGVIDTFYVHKDVLRDVITGTQGDNITAQLTAGRVVRKVYKTVLDAAWKPENMSVVAFVHEFQNSHVVYQGKKVSVE